MNFNPSNFCEFGFNDSLLKGISKLGWRKPTEIQKNAINKISLGKNLIIKAATGSGKTGAFILPIIQNIIENKNYKALIIVPSSDLSIQIYQIIKKLLNYCNDITCEIFDHNYNNVLPNIIISTPTHIAKKPFDVHFDIVVFDEADLLFSFGYKKDIFLILKRFVNSQLILLSATINKNIKILQNTINNPFLIQNKLDTSIPQLNQYLIKVENDQEKFTIAYILLKLGLLKGKTLFYVNNIEKCYKLKLFLELFGINCCLLNWEMPLLSRVNVLTQFNQGLFDYVIAADDSFMKSAKSDDFHASRGLDFQKICNVVNFDFPVTKRSYIHRVGRTARAFNHGNAISFVKPEETVCLDKCEMHFNPGFKSVNNFHVIKEFLWPKEQMHLFSYRCDDVYKSITRILIKETRINEIKAEILNNERLKKEFFPGKEINKSLLKHKSSKGKSGLIKGQAVLHLRHIPQYLVPKGMNELPKANKPVFAPKKKKRKVIDPLK